MEITVLAGLYNPTVNQASDRDLLTHFEKAKHILQEATPNGDFNSICKEWKKAVKDKKAIMLFAKEKDEFTGILFGLMVFNPYTEKKVFTECHWYVLRKHRKNAGIELFKKALEIAKLNYCTMAVFNSPPDLKSLINFYEKQNFKPINICFSKELK